jgi:hypothetical protein
MAIIISKEGKDAQKVDRGDFVNEDYMQEYIKNNPDAIPVYEIQKDKKLFVAKREFQTNSGPIDALAVDGDGDIYIVETKLFRNSDKRTVVAQALDYGAALWKHLNDFDNFLDILSEETQKNFDLSFQDKIKDFFDMSDEQLEIFMKTLRDNLNDGNLKFVILMDEMDERLKDLIIYINQNSQFDIYAVQLEYYKHQDFEIMIPKIFGVEVKKNIKTKSVNSKSWNEKSFLENVKNNLGDDADKIISLYNYFKKEEGVNIKFGKGQDASFGVAFDNFNKTQALLIFYAEKGNIEVKQNRLNNWLDSGDVISGVDECKTSLDNLVKYIKNGTNISLEDLDQEVVSAIKDFTESCERAKLN